MKMMNNDNQLTFIRDTSDKNLSTSMELFQPSTIYDKKGFELSVTTRSTTLPFPDSSQFKVPDDAHKLTFTIPFNSVFRRLLENDLYNERLLCVVNGGDPYYGANLINNLCAVLTSDMNTYVYCPDVKSQPVQLVRQTDATIEDSLKNRLGYNFAYQQRLIDNGTLKTAKYSEYLDYVRNNLSATGKANKFIRYAPSEVYSGTYFRGKYYFGTNHGIFMCDNPFIENGTNTSVVWSYGQPRGDTFIEADKSDALHTGLFNYSVVQATVNKTMIGDDIASDYPDDPLHTDLESLLPQFKVFKILPVEIDLVKLSSQLSVEPVDDEDRGIKFKREIDSSISAVECFATTDHGLWALINTTLDGHLTTTSVGHFVGWEEDQVNELNISHAWVPCTGTAKDPDGNFVSLEDQTIQTLVESESELDVFYIGTTNGVFKYQLAKVEEVPDPETEINQWVVEAAFSRIYGNYDASVSSLVCVHPEGYDESVLAGTDFGVLQVANGWYPNIRTVNGEWAGGIDFSKVVGIGLRNSMSPVLVALHGCDDASLDGFYSINSDSTVSRIHSSISNVYAIYDDGNGGWVSLINDTGIKTGIQLYNPGSPNDWQGDVEITIDSNGHEVTQHMMSPNGNIYFTDSGNPERLYRLKRNESGGWNSISCAAPAPISSFTVSTCDEFEGEDIPFVAAGNSVYAFLPLKKVFTNNFFIKSRISGGKGIRIVGHAYAQHIHTDVTFCQKVVSAATDNGLYVVKTSDLENAPSKWVKVSNETTSNYYVSITNYNGHDILATSKGLYLIGLTSDDSLWVGTSQTNPNPILNGNFTGVVTIDNPFHRNDGIVKFLVVVDSNSQATLYSVDFNVSGGPRFKSWDSEQITSKSIVPSPLNGSSQLSGLVIQSNQLRSLFAGNSESDSFDMDTKETMYANIDVVL